MLATVLILALIPQAFSLNSHDKLSQMANMKNEINHLLRFVKNTQCQYERNGEMHSGEEAVTHITKKYDYFKKRIKNSEDFIHYAATKSKISGKYYQVHCANANTIKSADWLLEELSQYRLSH